MERGPGGEGKLAGPPASAFFVLSIGGITLLGVCACAFVCVHLTIQLIPD